MRLSVFRPITLIGAVIVLIAGCGAAVTTINTPTINPDAGPPTATGEKDGIVVELWLQSTQVKLGEDLVALVRLTNRGSLAVMREGNTCGGGPAPAEVVQNASGRDVGQQWEGIAAAFKKQVLEDEGLSAEEAVLGGMVDSTMAHPGPILMACGAYSKREQFSPGAGDQMLVVWTAKPAEGMVLTPGTATVRATFTSYVDPGQPGPEPLTVHAETNFEIVGESEPGSEQAPTLVEFVDAALSYEPFMTWLVAKPVETWGNPLVSYWPNDEGGYPPKPPYNTLGGRPIADIGLSRSGPEPDGEIFEVIVDRATAQVLAERRFP